MNKLLIPACLIFFGTATAVGGFWHGASAAPVSPVKAAKDVETRIIADKMTYQSDKQQVVFETKVHVIRPDFELWSDKLTVYMKPPPQDDGKPRAEGKQGGLPEGMATGDVDRLVAERNVRMTSDGREGTSSKATYTVDTEILLMEGDPKVADGDNVITGDIIKYYTKENRSEVLGSSKKRVEAVFSTRNKPTREGKR